VTVTFPDRRDGPPEKKRGRASRVAQVSVQCDWSRDRVCVPRERLRFKVRANRRRRVGYGGTTGSLLSSCTT